jgi:predicted peroxiredoxin
MDAEAIVVMQSTGVFLAKKDYARHIHANGFPPLQKLMEMFAEGGGKVYACEPCARAREISSEDLLPGIEIVSGPTLVDFYLDAKNVAIY